MPGLATGWLAGVGLAVGFPAEPPPLCARSPGRPAGPPAAILLLGDKRIPPADCLATRPPTPTPPADAPPTLRYKLDHPDTGSILYQLELRKTAPVRWNEALSRYFTWLDRDGDQQLNSYEWEQALSQEAFQTVLRGQFWRANEGFTPPLAELDTDQSGLLSLSEFLHYYEPVRSDAWFPRLDGTTSATPEHLALLRRLDTNQDGRLSREELAQAAGLLPALDQNEDELLDRAELLTPRSRAPRRTNPNTTKNEPKDPKTPNDPPGGTLIVPPEPELIPAEEPDATKQADRLIRLELGRDHLQVLTIQPIARHATATVPRWLAWDGLRLTLRWPNPADTSNDDAQAALNEFLDAVCPADPGFRRSEDVDFNRDPYLAEIFERADRNADRVLTRQELRDYQQAQLELMRLGAVVRLAWESASLWDWLDQNRDGRLSLRELNHAAAESLPREGPHAEALDTSLRSYELILEWTPGDLRLVDQLRELHQPGAAAGSGAGSGGAGGSPRRRRGEGPIWFDAMDRNQDGDLTPREFLGTPAQFQELDTNQDGLISRAEARAAKRPAPTTEARP